MNRDITIAKEKQNRRTVTSKILFRTFYTIFIHNCTLGITRGDVDPTEALFHIDLPNISYPYL